MGTAVTGAKRPILFQPFMARLRGCGKRSDGLKAIPFKEFAFFGSL